MTSTELVNMLQALLDLARAGHAASAPPVVVAWNAAAPASPAVTITANTGSVAAGAPTGFMSDNMPPVVVPAANVGPAVTKEQVKGAIVALANAKGRAAAEAVLRNHGATHVDKLHDSRYAACFEDLQRAKAAT